MSKTPVYLVAAAFLVISFFFLWDIATEKTFKEQGRRLLSGMYISIILAVIAIVFLFFFLSKVLTTAGGF